MGGHTRPGAAGKLRRRTFKIDSVSPDPYWLERDKRSWLFGIGKGLVGFGPLPVFLAAQSALLAAAWVTTYSAMHPRLAEFLATSAWAHKVIIVLLIVYFFAGAMRGLATLLFRGSFLASNSKAVDAFQAMALGLAAALDLTAIIALFIVKADIIF